MSFAMSDEDWAYADGFDDGYDGFLPEEWHDYPAAYDEGYAAGVRAWEEENSP